MKLTTEYYFPVVTDAGCRELYNFADSVLFKAGRNLPVQDFDDIRQAMVLACLEKLPKYDASRGIALGGFLYWQCRGAISTWANKHRKEFACGSGYRLTLIAAYYNKPLM